jgi:hypothetical protein
MAVLWHLEAISKTAGTVAAEQWSRNIIREHYVYLVQLHEVRF